MDFEFFYLITNFRTKINAENLDFKGFFNENTLLSGRIDLRKNQSPQREVSSWLSYQKIWKWKDLVTHVFLLYEGV